MKKPLLTKYVRIASATMSTQEPILETDIVKSRYLLS